MAIEYHYDNEMRILFGEMTNTLTIEEFRNALNAFLNSEEIPSDVNTLWNLENLDFDTLDNSIIADFIAARMQNPQRGEAKLAFVVNDDFAFGMTRMYEGRSALLPQKTMTFRSQTEAVAWLLE